MERVSQIRRQAWRLPQPARVLQPPNPSRRTLRADLPMALLVKARNTGKHQPHHNRFRDIPKQHTDRLCLATVALTPATAEARLLTAGRAVRASTALALVSAASIQWAAPAAPASSPTSSRLPSPNSSPQPTHPSPPPPPPLRQSNPSPRAAVAELALRARARLSEYVFVPLSLSLPLLV